MRVCVVGCCCFARVCCRMREKENGKWATPLPIRPRPMTTNNNTLQLHILDPSNPGLEPVVSLVARVIGLRWGRRGVCDVAEGRRVSRSAVVVRMRLHPRSGGGPGPQQQHGQHCGDDYRDPERSSNGGNDHVSGLKLRLSCVGWGCTGNMVLGEKGGREVSSNASGTQRPRTPPTLVQTS
jgi:hypothetical protein